MDPKFINKDAEALVEAMTIARIRAEEKRKGREWGSIMLTIANWYPEDRLAIMQSFGLKPEAKPTTGARRVPYKPKGATLAVPEDDCPGCPSDVTPKVSGKPIEPKRAKTETVDADFILSTYGNDIAKLAIHASRIGLDVKNMKSPKRIAEKIAAKMNET